MRIADYSTQVKIMSAFALLKNPCYAISRYRTGGFGVGGFGGMLARIPRLHKLQEEA